MGLILSLIYQTDCDSGTKIFYLIPLFIFCLQAMGHGVTEEVFINWLLKEPQTLLWLPTMHRMAASEAGRQQCYDITCQR